GGGGVVGVRGGGGEGRQEGARGGGGGDGGAQDRLPAHLPARGVGVAPPHLTDRRLLVAVMDYGQDAGRARLAGGVAEQADVPDCDDGQLGRVAAAVQRAEQHQEQHGQQDRERQRGPVPEVSAQQGLRQAAQRPEVRPRRESDAARA